MIMGTDKIFQIFQTDSFKTGYKHSIVKFSFKQVTASETGIMNLTLLKQLDLLATSLKQ